MQISLLLKKNAAQRTREQTREEHESRVSTQKTAGGRGKCALTKVRVRGAPTCHAASKHDVDDLGSMAIATHNARAMLLHSRKRPISLQKPVKLERDTCVRRRSRAVVMSRHIVTNIHLSIIYDYNIKLETRDYKRI